MDNLLLNLFMSRYPQYAALVSFLITTAAGLAVISPPPAADGWTSSKVYQGYYRGIQWVALNFGHARNANDPVAIQAARDTINNAPTASVG